MAACRFWGIRLELGCLQRDCFRPWSVDDWWCRYIRSMRSRYLLSVEELACLALAGRQASIPLLIQSRQGLRDLFDDRIKSYFDI